MNKKQLQESIMDGVKRAFRTNKSINEGFSAWKEQNVPRIDYTAFNTCIDSVSEVLSKLINAKQIDVLYVLYHDVATGTWKNLKEQVNPTGTNIAIQEAIKSFRTQFCGKDEDKFVNAINEIYIKLYIPKSSHLMKYITSTIDPGSSRIKNMPYFTLIKGDENHIGLRFSLKALLDNCNEIVEYFS